MASSSVGRATRSGREFSPWAFGPPIRSHLPYSIAGAIKAAAQERQMREDAGYESVDERDVETPTPPPSVPNSPNQPCTPLPFLPEPGAPEPDVPTSSPPAPPKPSGMAPGKSSRLRHRHTAHVKSGNKMRQKRKREAEQALTSSTIKAAALRHRRNSNPITPSYDYSVRTDAPATKPGWVARNLSYEKELLDLETLIGPEYNMVLVPWDGVAVRPVIEDEDRVVVILGGSPRDAGWSTLANDGAAQMEAARLELEESGVLEGKHTSHRRGDFTACAIGCSHGGGRKRPGRIANHPILANILQRLVQHPTICRIAGFTQSAFKLYAPRLYNFYKTNVDQLYEQNKALRRNFKEGIWPAATFNLGPFTITFKHTDPGNYLLGWCSITSFGPFDSKRGGHLILWDLGLVVEFPPGSTIFVPSAIVTHSNIPIQPDERRYSFTQYCAGGILRYVANGFRTEKEFLATASREEQAQREADRAGRWERGLDMFPKLSEFTPNNSL